MRERERKRKKTKFGIDFSKRRTERDHLNFYVLFLSLIENSATNFFFLRFMTAAIIEDLSAVGSRKNSQKIF